MAHGNEINSNRFYWLKMDRHFFNDARLKKLRRLPQGEVCVIIYQKLLLLSIQYDGRLIYERIEDTFEKEMALKLDEEEDLTEETIRFLRQQGMLVPVTGKDDEYLLVQAQNSIGSETKNNVYKRQKQAEKAGLEKLQPNSNQIQNDSNQIPTELELELDILHTPRARECAHEEPLEEEGEPSLSEQNEPEEDAVSESDASNDNGLDKFLDEHPTVLRDSDCAEGLDWELLGKKIAASGFLSNVTSLAWLVKQYTQIVSGYYDDIPRSRGEPRGKGPPKKGSGGKVPHFKGERAYTEADFAALVSSIDDIPI